MKIQSNNADIPNADSGQSDLEITVRMLGDKWKYQILNALLKLGPLRFSMLQMYIPSISPTVLTEQLKALEAFAIICHPQHADGKTAKEYALTALGKRAWPIINEMEKWGKETKSASIEAVYTVEAPSMPADKSFNYLKETMLVRKMKKNEMLLKEGSVCNFIGFVNKGALRSFVTSDDAEFNNDFYLPDSIVCALTSFLSRKPTNCNIEALVDTEICLIGYDRFTDLVEKDVNWLRFARIASESFFIRKCRRETSFLKHSTPEKLQMAIELFPEIEQIVPQYHIASYLGIRPESLSRSKLLTYVNR